jgi:hypothetical protein
MCLIEQSLNDSGQTPHTAVVPVVPVVEAMKPVGREKLREKRRQTEPKLPCAGSETLTRRCESQVRN